MLYSETAIEPSNPRPQDDAYTVVWFNERVRTNIRRFIVLQDCHGFVYAWQVNRGAQRCWTNMDSSSIGTYSGRGALKKGCAPWEYTIVYLSGINPASCYLPGEYESGMVKEPIEIVPADASVTLRTESRIRFSKIYPIEKNVKVKNIGQVHPQHLGKLLQYWSDMGSVPSVAEVKENEQQQKDSESEDNKRIRAGWSAPNDESDRDAWNVREMNTQKRTTIQTGENAGDKSHFLDAEDFLDEEESLDEGDVQDHDIDERPQSSASQSYTNEDDELTKSANAETHFSNILTEFVPDTTQEESPNTMTRSNDTLGKADATEVDDAISRWLQDINYQLTGDLHSG
jgi:hypothetical protein